MARQSKLLALIAGSALALTGVGFAQTAPAAKQPQAASTAAKSAAKVPSSVSRGMVKSISGSQLVISQKVNGKEKDLTFQMNTDTQKQGDIKEGSNVTVHYRNDNKKEIATMVRATTAKTAAAAKTPKKS